MKSGGGRNKGSAFERLVSKLFLEAFKKGGVQTKPEDCFRTPLSGGHRFASKTDPGDLQFSKELTELFPMVVECKHYRELCLERYLQKPKKSWKEFQWLDQVSLSSQQTGRPPVLVMRGNNGVIFCGHTVVIRLPFPDSPWKQPSIIFGYKEYAWWVYPLEDFLRRLSIHVSRSKKK